MDDDALVSPQMARALAAEQWWWHRIETEHDWLTEQQAAQRMGTSPEELATLREAGRLLSYEREEVNHHPAFQFNPRTSDVRPVIGELLAISRSYDVPDEDVMLWLCSRTSYFPEQDRPVDHLDDPLLLLAAARDEFGALW